MAAPIGHQVKTPKIGPDAHDELETLLQGLHEHGILRFANDVVRTHPQIAKVVVDGLNREGSLNAIQNLSILAMALSRIPPAQFYKVVFALKDGLDCIAAHAPADGHGEAPGVGGAYRMLHDESLWRSVRPLIEGLKVFARGLDRKVDKPISDFTGKPSRA